MAFRDDREAMRARIGVLERQLADAERELARAREGSRPAEVEEVKERVAELVRQVKTERGRRPHALPERWRAYIRRTLMTERTSGWPRSEFGRFILAVVILIPVGLLVSLYLWAIYS